MTFPTVSFHNNLSIPVVVYDAFDNEDQPRGLANFFGTLTSLGTVTPAALGAFPPLHGPLSTYILYDANNTPIKRVFTLGNDPATFEINQADVDIMTATNSFLDFITTHPNDPLATSFQTVLAQNQPSAINAFFAASTNYKTCTFITYMLALVARATTKQTAAQPPEKKTYSLASLCAFMGVNWPAGLPDIELSNFSCTDNNDTLKVSGVLDISALPFENDAIGKNIVSLFPPGQTLFTVAIMFHYGFDAGVLGTRLQFTREALTLPGGINVHNPTITLDINPLFKFVVFTLQFTLPFSVFGKTFDGLASLTVDNLEAAIGVVIQGDNTSLPALPIMKGVHFDQFGVGMGVFFEPPGYALGIEGKFHIGDGAGTVALDDDTFAIVFNFEGDTPNPIYLAFYVPQLNMNDLVATFTNSSANIDFPVSALDLSFRWAENPLEPVILPDGNLSSMGYGFSGYLKLFNLSFFGDVEIGADGLHGTLTLAPLAFGNLLRLFGRGKEITIKVDDQGNPIKDNQVATTKAMQDIIANAKTKQLVAPGGPEMMISTSASPYFTLDAGIQLLGVFSEQVDATISKDGISFELDASNWAVLASKIQCTLQDYHNFSGQFSWGLNLNVPLPTINGFSLGALPLQTLCNIQFGINTSETNIVFTVGGGFEFGGLSFNIGPYAEDINISTINVLLSAIGNYILGHQENIFTAIITDPSQWAAFVKNNLVAGVANVAQGLKDAFKQSEQQAASIMKSVGYTISDISSALDSVFNLTPQAASIVLQGIGYSVDQISNAFAALGGDFSNYVSTTSSAVISAGTSVGTSVVDASNTVGNGVVDATNTVGNGVVNTADTVGNSVEDAANTVGNGVVNAADTVGEGTKDAAKKVGKIFKKL